MSETHIIVTDATAGNVRIYSHHDKLSHTFALNYYQVRQEASPLTLSQIHTCPVESWRMTKWNRIQCNNSNINCKPSGNHPVRQVTENSPDTTVRCPTSNDDVLQQTDLPI